MSQQTIWGRRNPKIEGTHWESLDINSFKVEKPIVICLGGNGTINEKDANGVCKIVENLLGLKLSSGNSEEIYEYADLIGVSYRSLEDAVVGTLMNDDINNIVNNVLFPLCVDKEGCALSIDAICKNLSMVTFFSYCYGDVQVYRVCDKLKEKLLNDLGFSKEETDSILCSMINVCYSPYNHEKSIIPRVFAMSEKDRLGCSTIKERDVKFKGNEVVCKIHDPFYQVQYSEIGIYAPALSPQCLDEHNIDVIKRDNKWQSVENAKNADCVSQMMAYALARAVANSINNFNSDTYIPKISMEELYEELMSIQKSFNYEDEMSRE